MGQSPRLVLIKTAKRHTWFGYMETSNPLLKRETAWSATQPGTANMTLEGTVNKCGILLLLCMGAAAFSWSNPDLQGLFILGGMLGGLVVCLIGLFKPATTPFTAPLYAVLEGLALGAISQLTNLRYPGIATNAFLLTMAVLGLMLFLYATRIIRVTNKLVIGVVIATGAIMVVYLAEFVLRFFGISMGYLNSSGPIGIGISLLIVGVAAFNLLVDFAVIEQNVRGGAPKYMEWYSGMALLVTLVWLYLEILRLLSKLRSR
jgi:uncharacterized YccA/Bax inhibitor family protein